MQTGLKSTSKWHEVVLVIPSTLTLVVFPSLHQSTSVVSWEVPYNELSKEEKNPQAWFTDGSVWWASTTQQQTA